MTLWIIIGVVGVVVVVAGAVAVGVLCSKKFE